MDVIYGLIPGMIILGLLAVGIMLWAAKSGQFEDLEGEAHRILMDEDLTPEVPAKKEQPEEAASSDKTAE
ncbi:cbb3-type cytochrome oxidase assembly protein CcoS [Solemya velesiana gill symbiont]|uniref:Cytochrome oxidase maturation protein, cbb3-type n=1 Tax=Solemya velesiana gill symbiont TaxID=1918948 RepID=A0A1T2KT62_9GAMM|nr:cbb3-type cytochrome oxidase assembly protein CcoS [Solemya velesiana gill symbiont]OOZ36035.1 cytochrome oxidase maturation protein, cbb3-type [Solemya velesiana gill symbiont]